MSYPERTVGGTNDGGPYQWSLQPSDVGKKFCVLVLDYYGRYTYLDTPVVQPLTSTALIVNFSQPDKMIRATANQSVAWRAVKIRSWKNCDAGLFSRPADHEGVSHSQSISKVYDFEIEKPYSYHTHVGGGEYKTGGFSYCFESSYNNKKFYNKSSPVFDSDPTLEISSRGITNVKVVYPNGVAKSMRAVEVSKNSSCSSASFDVDATKNHSFKFFL